MKPHHEDDPPARRSVQWGLLYPLLLSVLVGAVLGIGFFTFGYANGSSYLTNNPNACANCHVMRGNYQGWLKSSHHNVAVCNDCHTPPGEVPKYLTKAENGFRHSLAFTTHRYPDEIQITERSRKVTEKACLKCHSDMVAHMSATRPSSQPISCIPCHRNVGHM